MNNFLCFFIKFITLIFIYFCLCFDEDIMHFIIFKVRIVVTSDIIFI